MRTYAATPLMKPLSKKEAVQKDAPKTLAEYIQLAWRQHPALAAQHARWRAQALRVRAAMRWSDPIISYMFSPLPIETRLGPQRHSMSVMQVIPWLSKPWQQAHVERARARVQESLFDAKFLQVRHDVENLYWSIWALEQEDRLLRARALLYKSLEVSAGARVKVGRSQLSELAHISLLRSKLDDRRKAVRARRMALDAMFSAALGLPSSTVVSMNPHVMPPEYLPAQSVDELVEWSAAHPDLNVSRHRKKVQEEQRSRVLLNMRPDFEVGAQWSQVSSQGILAEHAGRDALMFRVGVHIPMFWDAERARTDAASASVVAASSDLELRRQARAAKVRVAYVRAQEARRRVLWLEHTLIPQAQAAFDMVRGDYEVGRAKWSRLVAAMDAWFVLDESLFMEKAHLAKTLAQLTWLVGRPLHPVHTPPGAQP